ncbi:hypothetical protein FGO68_gene9840 [Halteria grandinella]|uniref:Uncharacterized protein n=1 Tax=Halteria grandinella TaxID=5974 RepID=A0A8J8NI94_HALGN|nr:hypothetical protein FGO68_gene9840 [Halteria grandinella]
MMSYWLRYIQRASKFRQRQCHYSLYLPYCKNVTSTNTYCATRLFDGSQGCLTCLSRYRLTVLDPLTHTGSCSFQMTPDIMTPIVIELHVLGGDRARQLADEQFADILSALKAAYSKKATEYARKVIIYIDPNVEHFVTPEDYERAYPLMDQIYLGDQRYDIIIMQAQSILQYGQAPRMHTEQSLLHQGHSQQQNRGQFKNIRAPSWVKFGEEHNIQLN